MVIFLSSSLSFLWDKMHINNTIHGILTQIIDLDRLLFSGNIKENMTDCLLFHFLGSLHETTLSVWCIPALISATFSHTFILWKPALSNSSRQSPSFYNKVIKISGGRLMFMKHYVIICASHENIHKQNTAADEDGQSLMKHVRCESWMKVRSTNLVMD